MFENLESPDLIIAVKSNEVKRLKTLIDWGLNVNCKDHMGWSPLLWAAYYQNTTMMKILIDAGADIHYRAFHSIAKTLKMVDFYDLVIDKNKYEGGYKKTIKWIEENYPELVAAKKYNL